MGYPELCILVGTQDLGYGFPYFVFSSCTGAQMWVVVLHWSFLVRGLSKLSHHTFHFHCLLPQNKIWIDRTPSVCRFLEVSGGIYTILFLIQKFHM